MPIYRLIWFIAGFLLLLPMNLRAQQGPVVSFDRLNLSAGEVVQNVEAQTVYRFAFENKVFDTSRTVALARVALTLNEVLETLTEKTGYYYLIQGGFIVMSRNPLIAAKPTAPVTPRTDDIYRQTVGENYGLGQRPRVDAEPPRPDTVYISVPVVMEQAPRPDSSLFYSSYRDPDLYARIRDDLPRTAVKLNLLYGAATLTPNLAFEFALGKRATLEVGGSWNQWNYKGSHEDGNKKFNHYIIRPEYRHWFCERYNGHFLGGHAFFAQYNMSGYDVPMLFKKAYRYEGIAVGAGLTYGYHHQLNHRWGLEFHIGLGVAYLDYKRFDCTYCSTESEQRSKLYVGPTRAGISLVYTIK